MRISMAVAFLFLLSGCGHIETALDAEVRLGRSSERAFDAIASLSSRVSESIDRANDATSRLTPRLDQMVADIQAVLVVAKDEYVAEQTQRRMIIDNLSTGSASLAQLLAATAALTSRVAEHATEVSAGGAAAERRLASSLDHADQLVTTAASLSRELGPCLVDSAHSLQAALKTGAAATRDLREGVQQQLVTPWILYLVAALLIVVLAHSLLSAKRVRGDVGKIYEKLGLRDAP